MARCICGFEESDSQVEEHRQRMRSRGVVCENRTDKEYEAKRNTLIPRAERYANNLYGTHSAGSTEAEREAWVDQWNFAYHQEMNRLWKEQEDGERSVKAA